MKNILFAVLIIIGISTNAQTVNILPMGNSITNSLEGLSSYRRPLWHKLVNAGYDINFIGSLNTVYNNAPHAISDFDTDHEGHYGWTANNLATYLPAWLRSYTPDVALLIIGSNDIRDGDSPQQILSDIEVLFEMLRADNPRVTIFLGSLTFTTSNRLQKSLETNALLPQFVANQSTDESPVYFVNHFPTMDESMLYDAYHPNDAGDEVLAQNWFEALQTHYFNTDPNFVAAPSGLKVVYNTEQGFLLTWNDNASNEIAYLIERSIDGDDFEQIQNLSADNSNFTDSNIEINHTYSYRVTAIGELSNSNASEIVSYSTFSPQTPAELTTTSIGSSYVQFSWQTEPAAAYEIILSDAEFRELERLDTVAGGSYLIRNLNPLSTYGIIVTGINEFGSFSDSIKFTTLDLGSSQVIKINFAGDEAMVEGWNNIPGVTEISTISNNLSDELGESTGVSLELRTAGSGSNSFGYTTGNDSGIFPDAVMQTNQYNSFDDEDIFTLSNVRNDFEYTITLSGSREADNDRYTIYRVQDSTITIYTSNNTNNAAVFSNIIPVNGSIEFAFVKQQGSSYGYLAGMIIEGHASSPSSDTLRIAMEQTDKTVFLSVIGNSIGTYRWDFGDGSSAEGSFTEHVYESSGIYTINVTYTDNSGNESTGSSTVLILDAIDYFSNNHCLWNGTVDSTIENSLGAYASVTQQDITIPIFNDSENIFALYFRYLAQNDPITITISAGNTVYATKTFAGTGNNDWNIDSILLTGVPAGYSILKLQFESSIMPLNIDEIFCLNRHITLLNCSNIETSLDRGWNLISISNMPSSLTIDSVFQNIDFVVIKNDSLFYQRNFWLNSLQKVSIGSGYLIYVNEASTFESKGYSYLQFETNIHPRTGWNLIGINLETQTSTENLFELYPRLTRVKGTSSFKERNGNGDLNTLEIGRAYFFYFE